MATFPVKYINNNMRGAPQLSGTAGTLIAVLDAFLITGFGQVTALSVTVVGGIATASLQSGQSFDPYCVVWVDGATPAELNGEARVLTSSSTSITFATTAPDGVATGAITIKVAPVGQWEKPFTGTNQAAYRSSAAAGSRFYLYVDDTGTTTARVRGFETMTSLGSGTGQFPTDAMVSGGGYFGKSVAANTTPVRYDLAADGRAVLWAIAIGSGATATHTVSPLRGFGDMLALAPNGDSYAVALAHHNSVSDIPNNYIKGAFDGYGAGVSNGNGTITLARNASGLGSAVVANLRAYVGSVFPSGRDSTLGVFPSTIDGELKHSKVFISATDGDRTPRAEVPGLLIIAQSNVTATLDARDTVAGTGSLIGRKLLCLLTCEPYSSTARSNAGAYLLDITGPWR